MNWLINMGVKWSGLGAVWTFLDGKKTYGTAALAILGGLLGLGTEFAPAIAAHNAGAIFELVKHLGTDPSWISLLGGFGLLGLGHKSDKAADAATPPTPPNP